MARAACILQPHEQIPSRHAAEPGAAARPGVSTVSRVLNGSEDDARGAAAAPSSVSARWRPSCATRPIRRRQPQDPPQPQHRRAGAAPVRHGAGHDLRRRGRSRRRTRYLTFVSNTQDQPDKQRKLIDMAVARRVDGLILGDAHSGPDASPIRCWRSWPRARALRAGQPPCRRALRGNLTTSRAAASLRAICWTWAIAASR